MEDLLTSIKKKRPIVIIGAGGIIRDAHLPAYQKAGFEVLAIYDKVFEKAEALAGLFKIKEACKSCNELVEIGARERCVFDIALPASEIISVISDLPNGSGVLIQKPMGEDLIQAKEILRICHEKKLVAGINFQLRSAPYIQMARELIDRGKIGNLHDIDIRMSIYTPWHLWEFLNKAPRLEILYHSIHYIDLVRYFLGNPRGVYAKTTKHPNTKQLAATRSSIIMDYGEMIRANINTNHGHNFGIKHQESTIKFEGTEGAIKINVGLNLDYPKGGKDIFDFISLQDNKGWQELPIEGSWFPDAFIGPMAGLMYKLENPNADYINSVGDAIKTMEVVEDCYHSSERPDG